MRETLFKFLLSEIKAVRITCQHHQDNGDPCGGIIEAPIDRLSKISKCPVCQNDIAGAAHLEPLKKAIQEVAAKMHLAFVLPADVMDAVPTGKK